MDTILNTYLSSEWLPIIAALVVLANCITVFVSSKSKNPIWGVINDTLNAISFNGGKNKNADAE